MAVNRALRQQLAENLAAFTRGEKTVRDLDKGYVSVQGALQACNDDTVVGVMATCYLMQPKAAEDHHISCDERGWQHLLRLLAILETDYEIKGAENVAETRPGLLAFVAFLLGTALLGATCYLIFGTGFILYATLWVGSGVIAGVSALLFPRKPRDDAPLAYQPFRDKQHWLEHQYLIQRFRIPPYDPSIHHRKLPRLRGRGAKWYGVMAFTSIVALPFVAIAALISPILAVCCFCLGRNSGEVIVKDPS